MFDAVGFLSYTHKEPHKCDISCCCPPLNWHQFSWEWLITGHSNCCEIVAPISNWLKQTGKMYVYWVRNLGVARLACEVECWRFKSKNGPKYEAWTDSWRSASSLSWHGRDAFKQGTEPWTAVGACSCAAPSLWHPSSRAPRDPGFVCIYFSLRDQELSEV